MKILLDLQNSMWAVTLNSEFSLCGLNCKLRVFLRFAINRFTKINVHVLQHGTGSSIAIIGFTIWPNLTRTQLLNYIRN